MSEFGNQEEKERWNTGVGYYIRLNEILKNIDDSFIKGDKRGWYLFLFTLYKEIEAKCNPTEQKELKDMLDKILSILNSKGNNASSIPDATLHEWEITMRRLLEKKHMLTPKGDDPASAMSRGSY